MPDYQTLLVEKRGCVTLITLNRPQALNALNAQMLDDLLAALAAFDADEGQGCAVLTGSDKAFAAGADIKEMADMGFAEMYGTNHFAGWERFTRTRKPVIAAVAGYALGGGCEVAMMCDFILAADTAKFGQPEIKLGVSPGMGGSQRLTRGRRRDRRDAAACGARQQGNGERRIRDGFDAGRAIRAPPVQRPVRDAGSEGRHGRFRRKAAGELDGEITVVMPAKAGISSGKRLLLSLE